MNYFLCREGRVYGPYSVARMRIFLSEGRIQLSDLTRTDANPEWQPLHVIWGERCGAPAAWSAPSPAGGSSIAITAPVESGTPGNAFNWPFRQRDWFESIWMTLLWWFPLPIFPLGALVSLGWSIEAARRRAWRVSDLLPRPADFGRILLNGTVVSFFFCVYILLPVMVAWWVSSLSALGLVIAAAEWSWHYLRGEVAGNFIGILSSKALTFVEERAVTILYLFLAGPMFTAAAIRFAVTRKASSFVNLPACLRVLFQSFWRLVKFLLLATVVLCAVILGSALIAATGIGWPLLIPLGAAGIWVLTYLFGDLAVRVQMKLEADVRQPVKVGAVRGPIQ